MYNENSKVVFVPVKRHINAQFKPLRCVNGRVTRQFLCIHMCYNTYNIDIIIHIEASSFNPFHSYLVQELFVGVAQNGKLIT